MFGISTFKLALGLGLFLAGPIRAQSSSCCGGATNFPAVITTDSKAQFSVGMRGQWTVADANREGEIRTRGSQERDNIRTYSLTSAFKVSEAFQASMSVPVLSREVVAGAEQGWQTDLGDVSVLSSYEFLPETTYSPWQPRGFAYLRISAPTGKSIYEAHDPLLSSISGQGFYGLGLGAAFVKVMGLWDLHGNAEWKYLWARRFSLRGESVLISPGPQALGSIGLGYSPLGTKWRMGLSLGPLVTGRVSFSNETSDSEARWVWDSTFSASYLLGEEWMAAISYRDQTLWGPARNSPLVREVGFLLQHRVSQ
ncbi:MAG: hypothetical protein H6624_15275 [Bdellovibrionaceae bacterium]|nr:hypothetical protein [Bdellovibrionales bacterium]MCB9085707.1 hypothetical protein [Pseudobdellovibrionaceae bacterium]